MYKEDLALTYNDRYAIKPNQIKPDYLANMKLLIAIRGFGFYVTLIINIVYLRGMFTNY